MLKNLHSKAVYCLIFLMLSMLFSTPSRATEPPATIQLGIFPYYSAAKLLEVHQALWLYLNECSTLHFNLVSAPNFKTFAKRTHQGVYDVVITAPHLGVRAQQQSGYRYLLMTLNRSHAVFVVPRNSPIKTLLDLPGHELTLPPQQAIIYHLALDALERHGVNPENLILRPTTSHNNALQTILREKSDAAVFGLPTWQITTPENQEKLRVIGYSADIPGFFILVHPRIPLAQQQAIRQCLLDFSTTPGGQDYLQQSGLKGFSEIDAASVADLQKYVDKMYPLK